MNQQNYLIWSYEHQGWWRPEQQGYTKDTKDAARYDYWAAQQICFKANEHSTTIQGVPESEAASFVHNS